MKKVLIANRGAIACRVLRTLKQMKIPSIVVYAEADRYSLHVSQADEAYCLGEGPARDTYLNVEKILAIATQSKADAIHPGYGFLSENPNFARLCESQGIRFLGPTAEQMEKFGLKHTARQLASQNQVPLLPGSNLLKDIDEAKTQAQTIGFPLILKSSAGGGGIGMQVCRTLTELENAFDSVKRLSANNFGNDGVFIERFVEKARHIEVQIFGDGQGKVIALGERDCSAQRRNQKVIEECPAPGLHPSLRQSLYQCAIKLAASINYRSAGTVEFLYDADTEEFYFLEMNTRLQVEHGVTEEVTGIDLVEWMIREGNGSLDFEEWDGSMQGHSIQVRLYAEDPDRKFQPCTGLLSKVQWSPLLRTESWIKGGIEISPFYDPMLAKLISHGPDRETALQKLIQGLKEIRVEGIESNLNYLIDILIESPFSKGQMITSFLSHYSWHSPSFIVLEGGTETTVQDLPGRIGHWNIGVPPSGPMDALNFALGNKLLGNDARCAGLEITLKGPTLEFLASTYIVLTGADPQAQLNGNPLPLYTLVAVQAGDILSMGMITKGGLRSYLLFAEGIDVPEYMGSRSTFTLGKFGGYKGRALNTGDKVSFFLPNHARNSGQRLADNRRPPLVKDWTIHVLYGPHGAPDFFQTEYLEEFLQKTIEVHFNSSRTGIRLIAPTPLWARQDGGEAGLHPSNIHDNAYAIGTIDFTGDMPILLGPDGPSLGGFVCPFTIAQADLWKMGQLAPGDRIHFRVVNYETARQMVKDQELFYFSSSLDHLAHPPCTSLQSLSPLLSQWKNKEDISVVIRAAGDNHILVEYGALILDLTLRLKIQLLKDELQNKSLQGLLNLTPGIRSLQIQFDPNQINRQMLIDTLMQIDTHMPLSHEIKVRSRIVHLPLSWDDPSTQLAIKKYLSGVRPNAPWGPSNIEFIRRINGLESIDDVFDVVFNASYLVMGLGDVYLGAPVATPIDPRHRLVTTKYNPARTWTPENAVGIGGAYMCIYGMEGPGGYQFVGRTLPIWNSFGRTDFFTDEKPWLLDFFDQIRFYPVSAEELLTHRKNFLQGQFSIRIEESEFDFGNYQKFLDKNKESIAVFRERQQRAFAAERQHWKENGLDEFVAEIYQVDESENEMPDDCQAVKALVPGSIWKIEVEEGQSVESGQTLIISESMKTEFHCQSPVKGVVKKILCREGAVCNSGQVLIWVEEK